MVNDWIKSITNHLYWCVASSPEGDGNEMAFRWKSLMEHICDRHNECYHLPLGVEERRKKWFQPDILVQWRSLGGAHWGTGPTNLVLCPTKLF